MGGRKEMMVFHRFSLNSSIRVVLAEPVPFEYVWLSFNMHSRFRNGELSKELAKHVLHVLKGNHHIHWLPELTTFRELSRELNWSTSRSSPFFRDCRASMGVHLPTAPLCHPLFCEVLTHERLSRCPRLVNYVSRKDQCEIVRLIRKHFEEKAKEKPDTQQDKYSVRGKPRR